jgi:hypothetical protein
MTAADEAGRETTSWRPFEAPFEAMERAEDEAILQELRGEAVDSLVYELTDGEGRVVVGLSKVGVDRVAAEMALKGEVLREMDFKLIPGRDNVVAVVKAGRYAVSQEGREVLLETVFGTKRQPRRRRVPVYGEDGQPVMREGRPVMRIEEDPFVVEVAMMKAARNARRRLMPQSLVAGVIAMARSQGKVSRLDEAAIDPREPDEKPDPEATEPAVPPPPFPERGWSAFTMERVEGLRREIGDLLCSGPCPSRDQVEEWWERQGWGYTISVGDFLEPAQLDPRVRPQHLEAFRYGLLLYQREVQRRHGAGWCGG